ncbi:Athe_2463 domain-containing protein [Alkaliphilus hydrothermalis]|uniref:Uncharacterized protein n=1 Tax=Alkaliphilus hydrothermalis TaxID=1482730 RepID=A0ABS2NQ37_9FIRM|nr:hypothetical protein [Alkaliphilus hydrothermalis]MBM7615065.1 hypothetical protein [Alkaliphilus hydrothermalis]
MLKYKNNIIGLILIMTLLLSFIPLELFSYSSIGLKPKDLYEDRKIPFKEIEHLLPPGTQAENRKGFKLNTTIFVDKGIIVYGNHPKNFNPREIDFKKGTQNPSGKGYYEKEIKGVLERGEYRYHGQDYEGNPYTNVHFKDDVDLGIDLSEKAWIGFPWEKGLAKESNMTRRANYDEDATFQNDINKLYYDATKATTKNHQPYQIFNVLSPATLFNAGELRGWHVADNITYYQTFSVPKTEKKMTPVEAKVTIQNSPQELVMVEGQSEVTLEVKVEGILKDEGYIKKLEEYIYYTRKDIKEFKIELIGHGEETIKLKGANGGYHVFEVTVGRSQLNADSQITFTGKATAIFVNDKSSGTDNDQTTVTLQQQGKGFAANFDVRNYISLPNGDMYGLHHVNYLDGSIGKLKKYDYVIESYTTGTSHAFGYTASSVDNDIIDQALFNFIKPIVDGKTEEQFVFRIVQTVTQTDGQTDSCGREILIDLKSPEEPVLELPEININIPDRWYDIIPLPVSNSSKNIDSYSIKVNGMPVNSNAFLNGSYVFGASDIDRLYHIEIATNSTVDFGGVEQEGYLHGEQNLEGTMTKWVSVYSTKPRAQYKLDGNYKQNRRLSATNTSNDANAEFVLSSYPINNYQWRYRSVEGDMDSFRLRDISSLYKEFMFKEPGVYEVELVVTNTLGRVSDPYIVTFPIAEDYEPSIILNIWNNVLGRNEALNILHDVVSTEEDIITKNIIELYYDHNNDGNASQLLETFTNAEDFLGYTPTKLGTYKVVNTAEEAFGQPTLDEYITAEDTVKKVVEREFYVDNFRPLTELYIDIPIVLPEIDTYFMLDKNLDRAKNDYVLSSRMDIDNYLRGNNIRPKVATWDMHTYVYSQPASTSSFTGTSYPSSTIGYSSGGYSGTLNRYSVSDNGYTHDFGHYETKTESQSFTGSHTNTTYSSGTVSPYTSKSSSNPAPSSIYVSGNGYSGYIPRTGTSTNWTHTDTYSVSGNNWSSSASYTAHYAGTLTKSVQVWKSNLQWVNQYTGHYSGTIYKHVRQPYTDPFRTLSDKYIIYISDGNISELADLQMVLSKTDAKVILIGQDIIKSQIPHEHFILNNKPIDQLVIEALDHIATSNPYVGQYYVVAGEETFNLSHGSYDDEGDTIIEEGFQYVQDQHYYDTPLGMESFANSTYSETTWTSTVPTIFNKTGKFDIYRRIKDEPSSNPLFSSYSYYSNIPKITVYSHRRPIALAELDWDYDVGEDIYLTTWVDKSFDYDHLDSRGDKGIIERKVRYRRNGGEWIYKVPDRLNEGSYELEYYVRDVENTWSDTFTLNFTLSPAPPIQFDAKARAKETAFHLGSIPASESLEVYEAWTRYPFDVKLEVALYQGTVRQTPIKTIQYSSTTGTKAGNDIHWNNISYQIPETLPDGGYTLKVSAIGEGGQIQHKDFPVTVRTPINLVVEDLPVFIGDTTATLKGKTTKYPHQVVAKLYYQTPQESSVQMSGTLLGNHKDWMLQHNVPTDMEEGLYKIEFTATTPNGNRETLLLTHQLLSLKVENLRIGAILDFNWEEYFQTPGKRPTPLAVEGIHVKDMPVFRNKQHQGIKLGYRVKLKIDTIGLQGHGDEISIKARYYALDKKNDLYDAEIYVETKEGDFMKMKESSYYKTAGNMTLNQSSRKHHEIYPEKSHYNTWEFDVFIPYFAKAVKKGEELDLFDDNTFNHRLLIALDISGIKADGTIYDYTLRETQWGQDDGKIYGGNLPTNINLAGKGINHGEVFWYDLRDTALDDVELQRGW